MSAWVEVDQFRGTPSVVLSSDRVQATFLPTLGMLGASLTLDGEEYLSLHGGTRAFAAGHTTGLPLLHPWANRLGSDSYRAAGVEVSLAGLPAVHRDQGGLPIHGTMVGPHVWDILELSADRKLAKLVATFDYTADDDLLAAFPFPHFVEVQATLKGQSLRVRTTVRPTTKQKVPVSFGWHPYFRLPGVRRSTWNLGLPKRKQLVLDDKGLPTGETLAHQAENEPIGRRTFDDHFKVSGSRASRWGIAGGGKQIALEFDDGYPYAQVYVPPRKLFAAIEPMTAPVNALGTGDAPKVKRGYEYYATFSVELSTTTGTSSSDDADRDGAAAPEADAKAD